MVAEAPLDVSSGPEKIQEIQQKKELETEAPAQENSNEKSTTTGSISAGLQTMNLDGKLLEAPKDEPASAKSAEPDSRPATTTDAPPPVYEEKTIDNPSATSSGPKWPDLSPEHPLSQLLSKLPSLLESIGHHEVYGLDISDPSSFHTKLILQKFLRANANDVAKAEEQLRATLAWRKEFQPLNVLEEEHSKDKFGALGYVTHLTDVPGSTREEEIVTWNVYGAVKDKKKTFGDLHSFIRWRVALMELSLQKLALSGAIQPIPDYTASPTPASRDPYQAIQVHDYLNISFLRQDPFVKAASKKAIDIFQKYYPETLSRKFFVNVPVLMGWVFNAFKLILSKETVRKFTVLSYGEQLVGELGKGVPKSYGGEAAGLEEIGQQTKLV